MVQPIYSSAREKPPVPLLRAKRGRSKRQVPGQVQNRPAHAQSFIRVFAYILCVFSPGEEEDARVSVWCAWTLECGVA